MEQNIELKNCCLRYNVSGSGPVIVLLHGYLENLFVWDTITPALEKTFTVLRVDLPGHGKSECSESEISMEFMAGCVRQLLDKLNIKKIFLIGHSMGGYVSLAFTEMFPELLSGVCLFHSNPYADSSEKKTSRLADVDVVLNGGKEDLANRAIPNLFASQNLQKFSGEVERVKSIARATSNDGVIGALKGMANRPDRSDVIINTEVPVSFILGKYDKLIPPDLVEKMKTSFKKARFLILKNSGHMGYIEEPNQAIEAIRSVVR